MKLTMTSFSGLSLVTTGSLMYVALQMAQWPIIQPTGHQPVRSTYTRWQPAAASNDSARTPYLPDNLNATLWAETPMVASPTSMDIDARGRVWIIEGGNHQKDHTDSGPEGGRIVILEDTNSDGKADLSKVFVTDPELISPLGIAVIGNNVIVSCSPNLVVYTDENGDDMPDKKEIMLAGFGGINHDHGLHALVAGPDGKYYLGTGNAGPHAVTDRDGWTLRSGSRYGKANAGNQISDDGRVWTGGLTLRINPNGSGLKVMAHNARNSYETALDSYGNMWQSDSDDDDVAACRTGWLMDGGNAGYFSNDGTRSWQTDQRPGQPATVAHWHQQDPGILPVGDITGAGLPRGMVMYEGDELGPSYRGLLLSADADRQVVFSYKPEVWGAGYRMPRTDFISGFLPGGEPEKQNGQDANTRNRFRPGDVTVGPDGALYITDGYNPGVGGKEMPGGSSYGRIYRITPKNKTLKTPKIDLRTTNGQIAALLSPAVHVRMLGFDALKAQGEKVIAPVMALLSSSNPYHRARAVFLLAHLGAEGQFEVERLLKAGDASIRIVALRALRSITPENSQAISSLTASQKALLPLLGNLCNDPSAVVRREVAIALRDIPYADCRYMLLNLVSRYDGQDRYYLTALGQAADRKEEALFADLRLTIPTNPVEWDQKTANLVWQLHPASAVALLAKRAGAPQLPPDARQQSIVALGFIKSGDAVEAMLELSKWPDRDVAASANYWIGFRRKNDWASLLNGSDRPPLIIPTNEQKMLAKRKVLLDESTSATEKRRAAQDMSRTPEGGKLLLELAADGKLSDALIKAVAPTMLKNPDQSVRTSAKEYFAPKQVIMVAKPQTIEVNTVNPVENITKETEKVSVAPVSVPVMPGNRSGTKLSVSEIAALTGNERTGQQVFKTNCANCHRYKQLGKDIGPELTRISQKYDKNTLLDAILYPASSLAAGYEPWLVSTKTGQTYYGFLVSEGTQSVVIKGVTGQKHTIPVGDISSRRQYQTSLMPSAQTMGMQPQQIADLTAFLLKQ